MDEKFIITIITNEFSEKEFYDDWDDFAFTSSDALLINEQFNSYADAETHILRLVNVCPDPWADFEYVISKVIPHGRKHVKSVQTFVLE